MPRNGGYGRAGLTLTQYASYCGVPADFLVSVGLYETYIDSSGAPVVAIPYVGPGTLPHEEHRQYRKALAPNGKAYGKSDGRFSWDRHSGGMLPLYGVWRKRATSEAMVAEGASDCHVLWYAGLDAYGLPGTTAMGPKHRDEVVRTLEQCSRLFVIAEGDPANMGMLRRLAKTAVAPKVFVVSLAPHKDPRDLWLACAGDISKFRSELQERYVAARALADVVAATPPLRMAIELLATDETYSMAWLNVMTDLVMLGEAGVCERDTISAALALEDAGHPRASSELARKALTFIASQNRRDPLLEMLDALPAWDGEKRMDTWLTTYLGVKDEDWVRATGRKWLVSAIARAKRPGCQVDHALVLTGGQGGSKTTIARRLAGSFYQEMTGKLIGTRDTKSELQGAWVVEFPDLGELPKATRNQIKAFLTDTNDSYTAKYERQQTKAPRRFVFMITSNEDAWLDDASGARRFWNVEVGEIDVPAFERDRDQLLAEAAVAFDAGETWWFNKKDPLLARLKEQQERLQQYDPWHDVVADYVERNEEVTTAEILGHIGVLQERQSKSDEMRVGAILRKLGLKRHRKRRARRGEAPVWLYSL